MKKVTLAQLRSDLFDATSVIEDCVEIDPGSISGTFAALEAVLADLDALGEALFFKAEKLRSKMGTDDRKRCAEVASGIETLVGRLKIPALGDSRALLEKYREVEELKALQKTLRYAAEMDRDAAPVLDALLASDLQDDWMFLGALLARALRCGKDKEALLASSRRTEAKMVGAFKTALRTEDLITARTAFRCLQALGKEMLLIDAFLVHIADEVGSEISADRAEVLDLDAAPSCGAFGELVDRLAAAACTFTSRARAIFDGDPRRIADLFACLYRNILFPRLDDLLAAAHPLSFLHGLAAAAKHLRTFGAILASRVPRFEPDSLLHEGLARHLARVVQQEKLLFDEALDALTKHDAHSRDGARLVLLGAPLKPVSDPRIAFERMLAVVYAALQRCTQLYTPKDEAELLRYFFRRLAVLVDSVEADAPSRIAAAAHLGRLFLLTRRLLGSRISSTGNFTRKIREAAKTAFDAQIDAAAATLRKRLDGLVFVRPDGHAPALASVRALIAEGELLHGQNYGVYTRAVLRSAYDRLKRAVLAIVYAPDQGENMLRALDDFVGCAALLNRTDAVRWFSHLREIGRLITVDASRFAAEYAEYAGSISEQELKDLLKCRRDRDEIRKLL